jgi:predicted nucleotidyltransferase
MDATPTVTLTPRALIDRLRQEVAGVDHIILSGSCSRGTALPSNHDIDLLLALDGRTHCSAHRHSPSSCLNALSASVQRAFPESVAPRIQNRSVRLQSRAAGQCFDLVPAVRHSRLPYVYLIPDRRRDEWILTCPEYHRRISQDINRRTGYLFNPIVRLVKSWNYAYGKLLSSFHLEALAYRVFAGPRDQHHGLSLVLRGLADAVMEVCPDPAGIGPAIDENVDEARRRGAQKALLMALDKARDVAAPGEKSRREPHRQPRSE